MNTYEILMIEDDPADATCIRSLLSEALSPGHSLHHAQHLAEGLAHLRRQHFDVVLLDLGLPDSRGIETARAVRKQAGRIPIIVISDSAADEEELRMLQMDIQDYLINGQIDGGLLLRSIRYSIERMHLTEKLHDSEVLIHQLIENGILGIAFSDAGGRVYGANTKFLAMTGYERKNIEAGSVRWGLLTPHDSILRTHEATGERHAVQSVHLCEKEFVRQDGAIGWGLFAGSKLADKTGAITFMADITEQKRTMLELQSANDRLATADEEMDTLIHAVSHDLRSPLWIVDNFSEALRDEMASSLDGKAKDYLLHIQDSVYRMTDTIDAMLRIPRLTRGDLKRVSVDLSGLARSIADELGKNEPARQVELSIADGHSASGDPILLRNVLENLLDNAWKFTGKQREARIEFGAIQKDGNTIFFVRDNGVGFNMDRAEKLFYAFHRFHSSKDFPGLGVGLAIVRRIIRRHCGKVWANSEPDKGSTFYFSLWDRCCTSLSEPEL